MKPKFLDEMEEAFAVNQHVLFSLNTGDRFFWLEEGNLPANLSFFLAKVYIKKGYRVFQYISASGLTELNSPGSATDSRLKGLSGQHDPVKILNTIISMLQEKDSKYLFLIHYGEHLTPANSNGISASAVPGQIHTTELLHRISLDDIIFSGQSRVAIVMYNDMPSDLITRAPGYRHIAIGLPCKEERLAFIEFLQTKNNFGSLSAGLTPERLAEFTSGMPLAEIEKILRESAFRNRPLTGDQVKIANTRTIRQLTGDLLEVSEPEETLDQVAGLRHIKEFFKWLFPQLKKSRKDVPQSILINGIPGCGKSFIVRALANFLGWVLIEFRNIRGPYVGQSEQQLDHVIKIIDQFDNCIIFFDEIDQYIGQRNTGMSGDSGTSERMLARIFSWLGSMKHRGRMLFIGASNRPDLLDPALIDRFRVSISVLHPTGNDILEFLPILMDRFDRKFSKDLPSETAAEILSSLRFTGRGLEEIFIQAGLRADREKGKIGSPISENNLTLAVHDFLPSEDPLEMEFIALTAIANCSANSYLPWMNMDGLLPGAEIPEELVSEGIVCKETGRLDKAKLHYKIGQLSKIRQSARFMR